MNNVEAFKNELRNYHYYINVYKKYSKIHKEVITLDNEDTAKYVLLKSFNDRLKVEEGKLDEIFTKLTGFKAIRYDIEHFSISEELSNEMKLDLIDKYNVQLAIYNKALKEAENNLVEEMKRIKTQIDYIENVLMKVPDKIAKVCIDIYCNGKKYEDISNGNNVFWSASGVYWNVNKELERALGDNQ